MIQAFAPTPLTNMYDNFVIEEEKYFPDTEETRKSRREKDIKLISALRARA